MCVTNGLQPHGLVGCMCDCVIVCVSMRVCVCLRVFVYEFECVRLYACLYTVEYVFMSASAYFHELAFHGKPRLYLSPCDVIVTSFYIRMFYRSQFCRGSSR